MYYAFIQCQDKEGNISTFTRGNDYLQNSPSFSCLIPLLQWGKDKGVEIKVPPHNRELSPTMKGKQQKALLKKLRFSYGVFSWREVIDMGKFAARQVSIENAVKYNRRKYNGMDWNEQNEYVRKLSKKKITYSLVYPNEIFVDCPKLVWEYANKLPVIEKNFYQDMSSL